MEAGLQNGDVIVAIDGEEILNMEKYKQSEGNIHINYEIKDYNDEINYILDIIKYVCKDDELNIYTKIKNIEKENLELKERLNQQYFFIK